MGLSEAEISALIEIVRDTAREEIMPRFRRLAPGDIASKGEPTDLVTVADHAAEARITAEVRALMPEAEVVGEEAVAADPSVLEYLARPGRVVVIDPVDGTWNFAAGLATFGVILAVVEDGKTVFGLLYDPVMDDWVMARAGGGAWFCRPGEVPVRLSGTEARPMAEAHVFIPLFLFAPERRRALAALYPDWGRVSSLRCSCHEYRLMAMGHADVCLSPRAKPWDHAAGALVIEECGGQVWSGRPGLDVSNAGTPLVVLAGPPGSIDPAALWAQLQPTPP